MSAFDAPVFQAAIAQEALTGENRGVVLNQEETAEHQAVVQTKDSSAKVWGLPAFLSLLGAAEGAAIGLMGSTMAHFPAPTANTTIIIAAATGLLLGFQTVFFDKKDAWQDKRTASQTILDAGVRPLKKDEVLPPGRETVNLTALGRAAKAAEKLVPRS